MAALEIQPNVAVAALRPTLAHFIHYLVIDLTVKQWLFVHF